MIRSKEIITAIKEKNNSTLFTLLYKNFYGMVKTIVTSYKGNEDDAKDVFQDMMIILIREIETGKFDETKNIKNYLYTISKNLYLNSLKKHNKLVAYDSAPDVLEVESEIAYHENNQKNEELVKNIIAQLGQTCYEILKGIIFEKKKQEEIAEELGLQDRRVVKTYKNRCKKKLIELLQNNPKVSLQLLENADQFRKHIRNNR